MFRNKYALPLLLLPVAVWALIGARGSGATLRHIDPSHTCMGSNRMQEKPQSYAMVGDKRYYGCTDMCIMNLKKNPGFRYGTDPVSGKRVDKATSIVGARENGELLYFESEKNFLAYRE